MEESTNTEWDNEHLDSMKKVQIRSGTWVSEPVKKVQINTDTDFNAESFDANSFDANSFNAEVRT